MNLRNLFQRFRRLLKGQGGMEAIQTVAITAIAATVMMGVAKLGNEAKEWTGERFGEMKKESEKGLKEKLQDFASEKAGEAFDKAEDEVKDALDDIKDDLGF